MPAIAARERKVNDNLPFLSAPSYASEANETRRRFGLTKRRPDWDGAKKSALYLIIHLRVGSFGIQKWFTAAIEIAELALIPQSHGRRLNR